MKDNHSKGTWFHQYLTICRGRDYIAQVLCIRPTDEDFDNARLIAYASESYNKNCGPHAVECAESDLLGQCLEALEELVTEITNWEDDVRSVIQIPIEHGMDLSKAKAILTKRKGGSYEEKSMFQMR